MKLKLKLNEKTLKRVEDDTRERLNRVLSNRDLLNEVGALAIDMMRQSIRKGISPLTGVRFNRLSKSWEAKRENIARTSPTHPAYAKTRSNLTLTGQLVDSISRFIKGKIITLQFTGTHQPYVAKYKEFFLRKKPKRRVRLNKGPIKGFQSSFGGLSAVDTGRSGNYKIGKEMSNEKLAQYVEEQGRPFFGFAETMKQKLLTQVKRIVIRYIRRNL